MAQDYEEDYYEEQPEYSFDEASGMYFTGDPALEENWVYSPPGMEAPQDYFNYEPDYAGGGFNVYEPGELAPYDSPEFSSSVYHDLPPTEDEQVRAVADYLDSLGFGADTAETWMGDDGDLYTKDYQGNVFNSLGEFMGNDAPTGDGFGGGFEVTESDREPPPPVPQPRPTRGTTPRPQPGRQTGAYNADIDAFLEALRKKEAEAGRRFEVEQAGLTERERMRANAQIQAANTSSSAAAQRGASQDALARERLAAEQALAREKMGFERETLDRTLGAREKEQERAQRLALVQALMAASTGPNGPANRRMALELLAQMGVNTQGGAGAGEGMATNPLGIPPVLWDAMPDSAKRILIDAWVAQGGDPRDFMQIINDQRPQGQPSGTPNVRYAALAR